MPPKLTLTKTKNKTAIMAVTFVAIAAVAIGIGFAATKMAFSFPSLCFQIFGQTVCATPQEPEPNPTVCCFTMGKLAPFNCDIMIPHLPMPKSTCEAERETSSEVHVCSNLEACSPPAGTCPPNYTLNGDACCAPGEESDSHLGYKFCRPTEQSCQSPNTLCRGIPDKDGDKVQNNCCSPDQRCAQASYMGMRAGYCIPNRTCSNPCGRTRDGQSICCGDNEECKDRLGLPPFCQPKRTNVPPCKTLCVGTGGYSDRTKLCDMAKAEECMRHPSGYPYCYSLLNQCNEITD